VWSWDFVSDWTERGGAIRIFNLIDEHTRECHCIHADRKIRAEDVLTLLKEGKRQRNPMVRKAGGSAMMRLVP
jgi:hypothetical protein